MQQAKLAATEAPLTSATPRYAAATTNYARSSMTLSQRLRDDRIAPVATKAVPLLAAAFRRTALPG